MYSLPEYDAKKLLKAFKKVYAPVCVIGPVTVADY